MLINATITYQSVNPYGGKTTKTFPEMTDEELETAISVLARAGFSASTHLE